MLDVEEDLLLLAVVPDECVQRVTVRHPADEARVSRQRDDGVPLDAGSRDSSGKGRAHLWSAWDTADWPWLQRGVQCVSLGDNEAPQREGAWATWKPGLSSLPDVPSSGEALSDYLRG